MAGKVCHPSPRVVLLTHHAIINHTALTGARSHDAARLCEWYVLLLEARHHTERPL